jgi:DNA-binding transcriptional LysR family regulator
VKRLQQLAAFWGALPSFRAVSEVGGIRRAAALLRTSPAALSRTISQLEEDVGTPLFDRVGQELTLTRAGEELLARTRTAMREIDEVVSMHAGGLLLQLATTQPWLLEPIEQVAVELAGAEPLVHFEALLVGRDDVTAALTRGRADLAVTSFVVEHATLEIVRTIEVPLGVFAAPSHPLAATPGASLAELAAAGSFVAPASTLDFDPSDGWPAALTRAVRVTVLSLGAALRACRSGASLAVLPRAIATRGDEGASLREVAAVPPQRIHVVRRRPLGPTPLADRALAMIEARLLGS